MDFLKRIVMTFVFVFVGIALSTAIFISIFIPGFSFTMTLLWEIIIMSAVCAMGNLFFYSKGELSKKKMRNRIILHYLYINVIVFTGAFLWEWLPRKLTIEFVVMLVLVAVVYFGVSFVEKQKDKKTAMYLNKKLIQFNASEEEKDK